MDDRLCLCECDKILGMTEAKEFAARSECGSDEWMIKSELYLLWMKKEIFGAPSLHLLY